MHNNLLMHLIVMTSFNEINFTSVIIKDHEYRRRAASTCFSKENCAFPSKHV